MADENFSRVNVWWTKAKKSGKQESRIPLQLYPKDGRTNDVIKVCMRWLKARELCMWQTKLLVRISTACWLLTTFHSICINFAEEYTTFFLNIDRARHFIRKMMTGKGFIFEPNISPTTACIDSGRLCLFLSWVILYLQCIVINWRQI